MGLLTLYAALLLPWLGGALWLAFAESYLSPKSTTNRFRQVGYGFFVGYAVLFLAIMASVKFAGTVSWPGMMLFLLVFALTGGLAVWRTPANKSITKALPGSQPDTFVKFLKVTVLLLLAAHLVFMAVEVFTQPLYPWDAFVVWVYRAKAWFLSGGISEFVHAADWAHATTANTYTINALNYPLFASVTPYWAALSLGEWSETLVNVPVLFAGLAIGLALYGQCRAYGLSRTISTIACYLLYSIPIFTTHIALAGYADIWMSGYAGLGYIAIMDGLIERKKYSTINLPMALGFLMVGFAILVKNEGLVWFLAALVLFFVTTFKPRILVLTLLIPLSLALLIWAMGFKSIEIPLFGPLGFVNEQFTIPFFGGFVLEPHNIWNAYWHNFFTMGNWNLLWLFIMASMFLALIPTKGRSTSSSISSVRKAGISFFLIFASTQLFVFGLTDEGRWAETYTAINRLPVHFIPALLFTAIILAHSAFKHGSAEKPDIDTQDVDT